MPKILVVDDERDPREMTVMALERFGYEVASAHDGGDALRYLESNPGIALIITDLRMPGVDGLQLISLIRASEEDWKTTPIILISGTLFEATAEIEVNGMLPKPFRLGALREMVRELIKDGAP